MIPPPQLLTIQREFSCSPPVLKLFEIILFKDLQFDYRAGKHQIRDFISRLKTDRCTKIKGCPMPTTTSDRWLTGQLRGLVSLPDVHDTHKSSNYNFRTLSNWRHRAILCQHSFENSLWSVFSWLATHRSDLYLPLTLSCLAAIGELPVIERLEEIATTRLNVNWTKVMRRTLQGKGTKLLVYCNPLMTSLVFGEFKTAIYLLKYVQWNRKFYTRFRKAIRPFCLLQYSSRSRREVSVCNFLAASVLYCEETRLRGTHKIPTCWGF